MNIIIIQYTLIASRYNPVSQDVVFTPMESSHSIPITIIDNELSEANKTFTIQLCHTSSPLAGVCIQSTVTIVDDDGRGIRTV